MKLDKLYDKAYDWIITVGPRIVGALVILFVGILLIRLCKKWLHNSVKKRDLDPTLFTFIISVLIALLHIFLVVSMMQVLGIELTIFTALIASMGVAIGLALSGTLQNFASGVLILLIKPFKTGDNIIAQGNEGVVTSIQIFYTVVTTFDNRTVIIPNSKLSNEVIVNTSMQGIRRLDIEIKFNYGTDYQAVKELVEKEIVAHQSFLKDPAPRIGVSLMELDGYKVNINAWVNAHGYQDVKLDFQSAILTRLRENDFKLPGM